MSRHPAPMFEIFFVDVPGGEAYAESPEGARLAYWTLHRDRGMAGQRVGIRNLELNRIVFMDRKRGH